MAKTLNEQSGTSLACPGGIKRSCIMAASFKTICGYRIRVSRTLMRSSCHCVFKAVVMLSSALTLTLNHQAFFPKWPEEVCDSAEWFLRRVCGHLGAYLMQSKS